MKRFSPRKNGSFSKLSMLLVICMLLNICVFTMATNAEPVFDPDVDYKIVNRASGLVLQGVDVDTVGSPISLATFDSTNNLQKWKVNALDDGSFYIASSVVTMLEGENIVPQGFAGNLGNPAGSLAEGDLIQFPVPGPTDRHWFIEPTDDVFYKISNAATGGETGITARYITATTNAAGANVKITEDKGLNATQWAIIPFNDPAPTITRDPLPDGEFYADEAYKFVNKKSGMVLTYVATDIIDSKPVTQEIPDMTKDNQKFYIWKSGSAFNIIEYITAQPDYVSPSFARDGVESDWGTKNMGLVGSNSTSAVYQYRAADVLDRLWTFTKVPDTNYYKIYNKDITDGRILSVTNGSETAGTKVVMRADDGQDDQLWQIMLASEPIVIEEAPVAYEITDVQATAITVKRTNKTYDGGAILINVGYDANGMVTDIDTTDVSAQGKVTEIPYASEINVPIDGSQKVFIWNGFDNIHPLASVVDVDVPTVYAIPAPKVAYDFKSVITGNNVTAADYDTANGVLTLNTNASGNADVSKAQYIEVTNPYQTTSNFTISFKIKVPSDFVSPAAETGWFLGAGIVDGECGGVTDDFAVTLIGNTIVFGDDTAGAGSTLVATTPIVDGAWHEVVVVRAGGINKIYIDGNLSAEGAGKTAAKSAPTKLRIGKGMDGGSVYLAASLSDLRFYSVGLTASQVAEIY